MERFIGSMVLWNEFFCQTPDCFVGGYKDICEWYRFFITFYKKELTDDRNVVKI